MEREYICWRTGTGMAVFALGFLVALLVAAVVWRWIPDTALAFVVTWAVVFVPFLRLSYWADRRRLRRIRARRRLDAAL